MAFGKGGWLTIWRWFRGRTINANMKWLVGAVVWLLELWACFGWMSLIPLGFGINK
jgi:hypothetical protein